MNRPVRVPHARVVLAVVALLALMLRGASIAGAQAGDADLRSEIEARKQEQAAMRRELAQIRALLRRQAGPTHGSGPPGDVLVPVQGAPALGEATARVTIVEFSDYQCPFCRRHSSQVLPGLVKEYVKPGKVRYVFRDFPIASLHPRASRLHEAAHCAGDQGRYWPMHDRLFADPQRSETKDLVAHARGLGLDPRRFGRCLADSVHAGVVRQGVADGDKARVRGTPTFFVGLTEPDGRAIRPRRLIVGAQPYPIFKEAIEGLLGDQP